MLDHITHPTLYKRTSTGAIQIWFIEQDGAAYRTATGQINGKISRSVWKTVSGKNVGKTNETSGEEQADAEIIAAYKKKQAQGRYSASIDDIDRSTYFSPMLAHPVKKYPVTDEMLESGNVISQPKLDGIRCIANHDGLWTRQGKPLVAVPHIWDDLRGVFDDNPQLVLDGELYNHKYHNLLNRISGLCRKTVLSDDELSETRIIQYHMYDRVLLDSPNENFESRSESLRKLYDSDINAEHVFCVPTEIAQNRDHLDDLYAAYMADGYEGQMIRNAASVYENKRSKGLIKRKEFVDEEFRIVEILEGVGNRSGMAGAISYLTPDGKPFNSGIAGGVEFYKNLWENRDKYTGGEGTVRYFKLTEYGIPYLPVTHVVHEGNRTL